MRTARILCVIVLVSASSLSLRAQSQQPGIERTDLQRHDLSLAGREVVQVRVDFAPSAECAAINDLKSGSASHAGHCSWWRAVLLEANCA